MTLYLKDIVSDNFINLIPKFIMKRVFDLMAKNKYPAMQDYLKDNYELSIEDIVTQLLTKGFSYSNVKNLAIVRIDDNIKEDKSQEKLSMFVRLIDYGNLDVRGINLIHSSIEYIKDNILNIYRIYQMKGGDK